MEKTYHSLKDFELSYGKNAIERANDFQQYIEQLNDFGCKSYWITSHTGIGSTMAIEGFNEPVIAFISNDYLGMSQREETKQAGIDAIKKYGTGACAAQVIGGYLDIHQQLEKEIASFVGQEEAILFSSGFGANAGILRALLGQNDIALIDPYIHTSAMAGLKGTNIKRIGHNDLEYLEKVLKEVKGQYQTKLVIIDGVYSQDGDLSLLPEIITLCKTYETMLMLDDAHGIGVMGANGRGTAEYYNCLGQIDIITGTFSKSFGCVGGFAAASKKIIQYLKFYADSNVFSAAPTPQVTASILKALEIIKKEPQIRTKLWENTNYLRKRLKEEGFDIGWVLSIPFFISCIRQQNPLTVLSKIILRKVKQFNLPPPKKMRDFCIFEDTPRLFLLGNRQFTFIAHNLDVAEDVVGQICHRHIRLRPYNPYCPDNKAVHTLLFKTEYVLDKATGLGLAPVLSLLFFCQRMIPTAFLADYRIHAMLLHG